MSHPAKYRVVPEGTASLVVSYPNGTKEMKAVVLYWDSGLNTIGIKMCDGPLAGFAFDIRVEDVQKVMLHGDWRDAR